MLLLKGTHNPLMMVLYGRYDLVADGKLEFHKKKKVDSAITNRIIRIYVFWPVVPIFYWLKGLRTEFEYFLVHSNSRKIQWKFMGTR